MSCIAWTNRAVLALVSLLAASTTHAGVLYKTALGATVGNNQESNAEAFLENVGGNLQITLSNLATTGQGNITRLTNFEFNVVDTATWSLIAPNATGGSAASVFIASGSSIVPGNPHPGFTPTYGANGATGEVSGGWVFGTNVSPTGITGTFDYGVSATAFENGSQISRFDGSTSFGNYTDSYGNPWGPVNGGDWGLIGTTTDPYTGPSIRKSVVITLAVNGTLNLNDLESTAYFTYGSERDGVAGMVPGDIPPPPGMVPEPGSAALWSIAGLIATVVSGGRRRTSRPRA